MYIKEYFLNLGIFNDNKYLDLYVNLINNNINTRKEKFKTQQHHIIPVCYYKLNNLPINNSRQNLINLLFKNHILAHCYLVLASKENQFKYYNYAAINKLISHRDFKDVKSFIYNMEEVQLAYESSKQLLYENNPMFNKNIKNKHDNTCKTKEFRQHVSQGMKKYRQEFGMTEEHKLHIKQSREKRKAERKANGLSFYNNPAHCATRSIAVYCIIDGNKYEFKSIKDAGLWWFNNYQPFGDIYSEATYQRKIKKSINGDDITFSSKNKVDYKIITNIKWFKGGDASE